MAKNRKNEISFHLNLEDLAKKIFFICISLEVIFLILDYHINYAQLIPVGALRRMCNVAREDGIASWFASTQTLISGFVLTLLYFVQSRRIHNPPSKWVVRGWALMALFFLYMAVDDGAQVHERLASTIKHYTDKDSQSVIGLFPSYAWQILFLPPFALMGLLLLRLLWMELNTKSEKALLLCALTFLSLAVLLDFVEGLDQEHPLNIYTYLNNSFPIHDWSEVRFKKSGYAAIEHFSKAIEETLEMVAHSIFLFLFLTRISKNTQKVSIEFK